MGNLNNNTPQGSIFLNIDLDDAILILESSGLTHEDARIYTVYAVNKGLLTIDGQWRLKNGSLTVDEFIRRVLLTNEDQTKRYWADQRKTAKQIKKLLQ